MSAKGLLGKTVVGVVIYPGFDSIFSKPVNSVEGLILRDRSGKETVVRFVTLEDSNGGDYGLEVVWPAREVNVQHERTIRWKDAP